MNWDTLSDKDKVQLILQHVLPHEMADDIRFEHNYIEVSRRWTKDHPVQPINWPVAAWDDVAECWRTRDIGSNWDTAFDPLHNLNDAWLVVEKMSEIPTQPWKGELPPNTWFMHYFEKAALWACSAQEAAEEICKAALQAKGVDLTS